MTFNDVAAGLLRSRLYWLMGNASLLIQVTGRKSGRVIELPVNFHKQGSDLWIISSRDRVWWRNLTENPRVKVWIGGREMAADTELVLDENAVLERLGRLCVEKSWMAKWLNISVDAQKRPLPEELQRVAHERLFVRLRLN